jgi:RimJ/RimL family protein N-acetyltransferase
MLPSLIRTGRLTLRAPRPEDAKAIAEGIAHWDVIRWLTSPPWPYALEDARAFVARRDAAGCFAITEADGPVLGIVNVTAANDLGYWLRPSAQGRGLMTEAATALVAAHFASGGEPLISGHLPGNGASASVLRKLGFRYTAPLKRFHCALQREVEVLRMALTAADWASRAIESPAAPP